MAENVEKRGLSLKITLVCIAVIALGVYVTIIARGKIDFYGGIGIVVLGFIFLCFMFRDYFMKPFSYVAGKLMQRHGIHIIGRTLWLLMLWFVCGVLIINFYSNVYTVVIFGLILLIISLVLIALAPQLLERFTYWRIDNPYVIGGFRERLSHFMDEETFSLGYAIVYSLPFLMILVSVFGLFTTYEKILAGNWSSGFTLLACVLALGIIFFVPSGKYLAKSFEKAEFGGRVVWMYLYAIIAVSLIVGGYFIFPGWVQLGKTNNFGTFLLIVFAVVTVRSLWWHISCIFYVDRHVNGEVVEPENSPRGYMSVWKVYRARWVQLSLLLFVFAAAVIYMHEKGFVWYAIPIMSVVALVLAVIFVLASQEFLRAQVARYQDEVNSSRASAIEDVNPLTKARSKPPESDLDSFEEGLIAVASEPPESAESQQLTAPHEHAAVSFSDLDGYVPQGSLSQSMDLPIDDSGLAAFEVAQDQPISGEHDAQSRSKFVLNWQKIELFYVSFVWIAAMSMIVVEGINFFYQLDWIKWYHSFLNQVYVSSGHVLYYWIGTSIAGVFWLYALYGLQSGRYDQVVTSAENFIFRGLNAVSRFIARKEILLLAVAAAMIFSFTHSAQDFNLNKNGLIGSVIMFMPVFIALGTFFVFFWIWPETQKQRAADEVEPDPSSTLDQPTTHIAAPGSTDRPPAKLSRETAERIAQENAEANQGRAHTMMISADEVAQAEQAVSAPRRTFGMSAAYILIAVALLLLGAGGWLLTNGNPFGKRSGPSVARTGSPSVSPIVPFGSRRSRVAPQRRRVVQRARRLARVMRRAARNAVRNARIPSVRRRHVAKPRVRPRAVVVRRRAIKPKTRKVRRRRVRKRVRKRVRRKRRRRRVRRRRYRRRRVRKRKVFTGWQ